MVKRCLDCKSSIINDLESDMENEVPLWYKKAGNYSLLPKMLNCNKKFNPHKTELKEHIPDITDIEIQIPIQSKKDTWVFYWASLSNDDFKKIESPEKAYGKETNSGLVETDEKGNAVLILNCPQPYKVDNVTYPRHVHYTHLTEEEVWSDEIKTLVAYCHLTKDQFKEYLDSKSHLVINALPEDDHKTRSIPGTLNLPVNDLNDNNKDEKINDLIDNNIDKYPSLNESIVEGSLEKENIPMIIYCANKECNASKNLVKKLMNAGYPNVIEYPGGIKEWFGDKEEGEDEKPTFFDDDDKYNLDIDYETIVIDGVQYKHKLDDLNYVFDITYQISR